MYDGADEAGVTEGLEGRFEAHRAHIKTVAYRMLGSLAEAEDAVQEAWIRLSRTGGVGLSNLRGWLTTVVGRICLDMLRTRTARREEPLDTYIPDPVITPAPAPDAHGPEAQVLQTESVGLALMVILEELEPAERVAFVLHDVFGVPFNDIAPIVERSTVATRQLASRARRRIQGRVPTPDPDLRAQRKVVDAFLAAVDRGDFHALLGILAPDVVLQADGGRAKGMSRIVRGAEEVAAQARAFSTLGLTTTVVLVNGSIGVIARLPNGRLLSVIEYTVSNGLVAAMHILADGERLAGLDTQGAK